MIDYKYYEYDGMDPGLEAMEYDGVEYELDEFGERIGSSDIEEDLADEPANDSNVASDQAAAAGIESGFRETIKPENPNLEDQITDEILHDEAKSDYPDGENRVR